MLSLVPASKQFEIPSSSIFLPEILSALSFALDLTEGAVDGHAMRSCVLGMRIAESAGIFPHEKRSLYYAILLKDIGCSSNAARMCQIIGGDDRVIKAGVKLEDWTQPHKPTSSMLSLLWNNVLPGASALHRLARIGRIALTQHKNNEEMITLRCDQGASILRKLGMQTASVEAVRCLDEHWNGSGYPKRLKKHDIPLLARIAAIAQHLDAFLTAQGPHKAVEVLIDRSGQWFDPELVRITCALHEDRSLWKGLLRGGNNDEARRLVLELAPLEKDSLVAGEIDIICEAFADVIDAKSPFTYRHSIGVADAANLIASQMGLRADRQQLVRRASLLHDLGKLSVSNAILDKPGKLTAEEWKIVQGHPGLTAQILNRVSAFKEVASIAGEHHEKLDGSGYPDKRVADELCLESRIIAVADVYGALAEERPYRAALELDQILTIMKESVPHKLDPDCFEALMSGITQQQKSSIPTMTSSGHSLSEL